MKPLPNSGHRGDQNNQDLSHPFRDTMHDVSHEVVLLANHSAKTEDEEKVVELSKKYLQEISEIYQKK